MASPHVVIDGSNLATEGRRLPSLKQLEEAVEAFLAEYPHEQLTIVVDATFGHRIDPDEHDAFEKAVDAGRLISPPAGAIGRGDAFVLEIADRAGSTVVSNDSYQEFHGQFTWLFDEGRLIGGKPVPHVGWVFLPRTPVRGPASRRSVREARSTTKVAEGAEKVSSRGGGKKAKTKAGAKAAANRTSKPSEPASKASKSRKDGGTKASASSGERRGRSGRSSGKPREAINDALPFIEFVGRHPIGSLVEGEVVQFTSHGAYVLASDARCYLPLKSMGDPAPRSAKEVLKLGELRAFVVDSFDTPRRGVDISLAPDDATRTVARDDARGAIAKKTPTHGSELDRTSDDNHAQEAPVAPAKKKAPAKRKKAAAKKKAPAKRKAAAKKKAPAKRKAAAKKKAPAKKKKAAAKKKAPAKRKAAAKKKAPAKKKKAAAKRKAPAKRKAAAKKKAPAKRKAAAKKKAPAKKKAAAKRKAPAKRGRRR